LLRHSISALSEKEFKDVFSFKISPLATCCRELRIWAGLAYGIRWTGLESAISCFEGGVLLKVKGCRQHATQTRRGVQV